MLIQAVGLIVIWTAASPTVATNGAEFTGLGYALVFPGFHVEAVRCASAEARGVEMDA